MISPAQGSMLLIDDDVVLRERLARALRDRGFDVRTGGNYDEAMALAREEAPSHAVVDLRMPGRSGLELVEDLVALVPGVRVLVLTGYGSIAGAVTALRRGAAGYLPKPADADDLLAAFRGESAAAPAEEPSAPSLARAEWEHIQRVLGDTEGNVSEAARRLGIHRRSLQRKLKRHAPE